MKLRGEGEEDARPSGALEELDAALALLAAAIPEAGGSNRMEVLKRVFRVNNAIGRLARQEPKLGQDLYRLQSLVNAITTSVKSGDPAHATAWLDGALRVRDGLRNALELEARKTL